MILIAGKRNVGKTTFGKMLSKYLGAKLLDLSDVVREEMRKEGKTGDLALYALARRKRDGKAVFATIAAERLKGNWIVVGVRCKEEVEVFRKKAPALLIWIEAPENAEWRKRAEREKLEKTSPKHADELEKAIQTSVLKEIADLVVWNDGTLADLARKAEALACELKEKNEIYDAKKS